MFIYSQIFISFGVTIDKLISKYQTSQWSLLYMVSTQFKFDRTNGYITFSEISLLIMCLHVAAVSKFYKIL